MKCTDCLQYCKCLECAKGPAKENCEACKSEREERSQRIADIYCVNDSATSCSHCAAKYHKGCELLDTYELVLSTHKKIDEMLKRDPIVPEAEPKPITKEEVENYTNKLKENVKLYEEKKEKIMADITAKFANELSLLQKKEQDLLVQLGRVLESINSQEQDRETFVKGLEDLKNELTSKTKDEFFEEVVAKYKYIEALEQPKSVESVKKLKEEIDNFHSDTQMVATAKKLLEPVSNTTEAYAQEFPNLVYLLMPYSNYIYTYDVDAKTSAVAKMVDQNGDFRMKLNSVSLLYQNCVFLIGGSDDLESYSADCWFYAFLMQKVQKLQPMNFARKEHSAIALKGYIYVVGGWCEDGLTNSCEKLLVDTVGKEPNQKWTETKKLNFPRAAVSLCSFDEKTIYAIGGLTKDRLATYIEMLVVENFEDPKGYWEKLEIADPDGFCSKHQMVGSFGFVSEMGEPTLILFCGGETKEDSVAYKCGTKEKTFHNIDSPGLLGSGSLHGRSPLYTNKGKEVYFVGLYDILRFNTEAMKWTDPIPTTTWVSYK